MKRIFSLFILVAACCLNALASTRTTLTITITNVPANANTITINATVLTWKTSVATPSTEIAIGADIGASATNLFRHLASYQLSGPVTLGFSSSNIVTIQGASGQAMAASLSASYGTVASSTLTDTPLNYVRVPLSSEAAIPQTNNPTQLAVGMGTYSQSPFAAGTTLLQNIVQTSGSQTINGPKKFTEGVSAPVFNATNATPLINLWDTGSAADEHLWQIYASPATFAIAVNNDAVGASTAAMLITRSGATPLLVHFAVPIESSQLSGSVLTNCTVKQSTLAETNYSSGIFGHTRANNTSLANGNNAGIDFGAKVFVKIKAGPTGAFAICGIKGGADGRELVLYNATGQNMTIANDSGVEPTAANRIYTNTGADVVTTGNGAVRLIYDSEDTRWVVLSLQQ